MPFPRGPLRPDRVREPVTMLDARAREPPLIGTSVLYTGSMVLPSVRPCRPTLPPHLAEAVRPTSLSGQQILPLTGPLAGLLPGGGMRRGTTLTVTGLGATSLALALTAGPSQAGSWCAAVGMGDLNPQAVHHAGLDLSRVLFVPVAAGRWDSIVEALVAGVDVVLARPPSPVGATVARRLGTEVRLHRTVLIVVSPRRPWAEAPDAHLAIDTPSWEGIEQGAGHLVRRSVEVVVTGRRAISRPTRHRLCLD